MNKHELKQYTRIKREVFAKSQTLLELRSVQTGIKAQELSDMPKGHSTANQLELSVERCIKLEEELAELYGALTESMQRIIKAINTLDDPIERAIMELHYINGYTWEQTAVHVGYSWTQTHEYHGRALKKLKSV